MPYKPRPDPQHYHSCLNSYHSSETKQQKVVQPISIQSTSRPEDPKFGDFFRFLA